jgi:predicted TIM-barrel fold metal-dependent hydrolase
MPLNRRQFLGQSAAAATASLAAAAVFPTAIAQGQSAVNSDIDIIDCHQHLWDRSKFTLQWIKGGSLMDRNYVMADYLAAIEGTGIKNSIYMEVDVEPTQQQAEANHLTEICKSKKAPTIAAVISGRPASGSFETYIKPFKDNPYIKGIRQVLHGESTPAGYCLQDPFVRGIQLLGELNLSFDLCLRPKEVADGAALAEKCPNTRFILDHCGNADPESFLKPGDPRLAEAKIDHTADEWRRGIDRVAAAKNAICKISGIVARVPKQWSADDLAPIVNYCLNAFGPERVVFGSDWPVCVNGAPLRDWVVALKQIIASRPAAEQQRLLRENALTFYRLAV